MKFFTRRKKDEPVQYLYDLFKEPPLPPCPLNCQRTKLVGVWTRSGQQDLEVTTSRGPCEHQLAAAQHAAFDARYQQVWDPVREEWNVIEKRR